MSDLKTKPTKTSVEDYLATVSDETRLEDAKVLITLLERITKQAPVMWGTSIVGFGSYHYKYASGREGDWMKIGLSVRKEHLVLYGVIYYDHNTGLLDQLGTYKHGKGCLYVKTLAGVKMDILELMIQHAWNGPKPTELSYT